MRPAARIDHGTRAGALRQPLAQRHDLRPFGAGEDHPQRVEQRDLGVAAHRRGDVVKPRLGDEFREGFDLLAHVSPSSAHRDKLRP